MIKLVKNTPTFQHKNSLEAVRAATPPNTNKPLLYEVLEAEAKKIADRKKQCKKFSFTLDMTAEYAGKWDLSDGQGIDIVKYYIWDTYDYNYLSGKNQAIEIDNKTNYDLELYLYAVDADKNITPKHYMLKQGAKESFYAYSTGFYNEIEYVSINKLGIDLLTW